MFIQIYLLKMTTFYFRILDKSFVTLSETYVLQCSRLLRHMMVEAFQCCFLSDIFMAKGDHGELSISSSRILFNRFIQDPRPIYTLDIYVRTVFLCLFLRLKITFHPGKAGEQIGCLLCFGMFILTLRRQTFPFVYLLSLIVISWDFFS